MVGHFLPCFFFYLNRTQNTDQCQTSLIDAQFSLGIQEKYFGLFPLLSSLSVLMKAKTISYRWYLFYILTWVAVFTLVKEKFEAVMLSVSDCLVAINVGKPIALPPSIYVGLLT